MLVCQPVCPSTASLLGVWPGSKQPSARALCNTDPSVGRGQRRCGGNWEQERSSEGPGQRGLEEEEGG